jgi:O-antigen ligase
MQTIRQHIQRLYQIEFLLMAFMLPIYRKVIPYIIALVVLTWLVELMLWFAGGVLIARFRKFFAERHRLHTLLFGALYVYYLFGMLYTDNFHYGLFDLEVKLSLLIFPVIFFTMDTALLSARMARQVMLSFTGGVTVAMLLCYGVALADYLRSGSGMAFYYNRLSVLIHPSYLAMYVCFAISIILYFFANGIIRKASVRTALYALVFLFGIFIVMLSSKAGILSLGLVIALYASYLIIIRRRVVNGFFQGTVMAAVFVFLLALFPASAQRFEQSREDLGQADLKASEVVGSTGERIMIWWYALEITNEHFLGGVGTGDVKDHLLDKYREKEMTHALELELNAHNQYLQTMIALGMGGLILLLLCLVLPAMYSIERHHYLYLVFLLLLGMNLLFESMLETQAGVVFYAFFSAYLFAIKKDPASVEAGSRE